MELVEEKENKMGVMPVNKLLMNMSLPMMISMLVQALYNVWWGDLLSTCLNGAVSQVASLRVGILIVKKYTTKQG